VENCERALVLFFIQLLLLLLQLLIQVGLDESIKVDLLLLPASTHVEAKRNVLSLANDNNHNDDDDVYLIE